MHLGSKVQIWQNLPDIAKEMRIRIARRSTHDERNATRELFILSPIVRPASAVAIKIVSVTASALFHHFYYTGSSRVTPIAMH